MNKSMIAAAVCCCTLACAAETASAVAPVPSAPVPAGTSRAPVDVHARIRAQLETLRAKPAKRELPPYLEEDFDAACTRAKEQGKNVLVSFGREACGRCQVFYEYVKRGDVAVDDAKWVFIRLNVDNPIHREYFFTSFMPDSTRLPYVGALDGDRNAIGECLTGSHSPAEYSALMKPAANCKTQTARQ